MIGVYVHIPFCRTRCPYCDFVSRAIPDAVPHTFVDALCREIRSFDGPDDALTVFLGGGTPSLLDAAALKRILESLRNRFAMRDPEITIEANPDDVTPDLTASWRGLGINRVSLGVQSFDDRVLRYLGRRHDAPAAQRACELIATRFNNWAMDLIFGAHPVETWEATLDTCIHCAPKHVSAYGLTYEKGTPFESRAHDAVDDEIWLRLYRQAHERLSEFNHYEISNFARPGYECRHNLIYWRNEEYAGFGPAAYSFLDGVRSRNCIALEDYLAGPERKSETLRLSDIEIRVETLVQHFRLASGVSRQAYLDRFGHPLEDHFQRPLRDLIDRALIEDCGDVLRPTFRGFELNNEIGLALVSPGNELR